MSHVLDMNRGKVRCPKCTQLVKDLGKGKLAKHDCFVEMTNLGTAGKGMSRLRGSMVGRQINGQLLTAIYRAHYSEGEKASKLMKLILPFIPKTKKSLIRKVKSYIDYHLGSGEPSD
jgi:hypothetical protein